MSIYTIYKASNLENNKIYIGFTSNYTKRIKEHKSASKNSEYALYLAIRKYGWDAFIWEIIYQSYDKEHTHKVMETFFIKEYDSMYNGYNMTNGGEGNSNPRTEETKQKMSISASTQERIEISISNLPNPMFGEENGMFGKTHTNEIKNILSENCKQRFTGKSYEALYGIDAANELKKIRSDTMKESAKTRHRILISRISDKKVLDIGNYSKWLKSL